LALVGGHYAQNYPQGRDKLAQVVIPISFFQRGKPRQIDECDSGILAEPHPNS
jgi:hypothetical protein